MAGKGQKVYQEREPLETNKAIKQLTLLSTLELRKNDMVDGMMAVKLQLKNLFFKKISIIKSIKKLFLHINTPHIYMQDFLVWIQLVQENSKITWSYKKKKKNLGIKSIS